MSEALAVKDSRTALVPSAEVAKEIEQLNALEAAGPLSSRKVVGLLLLAHVLLSAGVVGIALCRMSDFLKVAVAVLSLLLYFAVPTLSGFVLRMRGRRRIEAAKALHSPTARQYLEAVKTAKTAEELRASKEKNKEDRLRLEQEEIELANRLHVLEGKSGYR